jgi:hypothetical protein
MINPILAAYNELSIEFPEFSEDERIGMITDHIDESLDRVVLEFVAKTRLPSSVELMLGEMRRNRHKQRYRLPEQEMEKKIRITRELQELKDLEISIGPNIHAATYKGGLDAWASGTQYHRQSDNIREASQRSVFTRTPKLKEINTIPAIQSGSSNFTPTEVDDPTGTGQVKGLDQLTNRIWQAVQMYSSDKIKSKDINHDEKEGLVFHVVLKMNDKDALEAWSKMLDELNRMGLRERLFIEWTEKNVLQKDHLVTLALEIMQKLGVRPERSEHFSAQEEIEER